MNRVKYTTTSTGTGDLTLTVADGFVGHSASGSSILVAPFLDVVFYYIVSEDGIDWEYGTCTIDQSGANDILERSSSGYAGVLQSTNSDNAINLPAGTHTVFLSRGAAEGELRSECLIRTASFWETTTTVAASGSASLVWTSTYAGHDPFEGFVRPGRPIMTEFSPAYTVNPRQWAPFARAFKLQLWVEPDTSGSFKGRIEFYEFQIDETIAWEARGDNNIVVVDTPWFGKGHSIYQPGDITCLVYNNSGGSIDFKCRLYMTYAI